jgi:hypothetical protein
LLKIIVSLGGLFIAASKFKLKRFVSTGFKRVKWLVYSSRPCVYVKCIYNVESLFENHNEYDNTALQNQSPDISPLASSSCSIGDLISSDSPSMRLRGFIKSIPGMSGWVVQHASHLISLPETQVHRAHEILDSEFQKVQFKLKELALKREKNLREKMELGAVMVTGSSGAGKKRGGNNSGNNTFGNTNNGNSNIGDAFGQQQQQQNGQQLNGPSSEEEEYLQSQISVQIGAVDVRQVEAARDILVENIDFVDFSNGETGKGTIF